MRFAACSTTFPTDAGHFRRITRPLLHETPNVIGNRAPRPLPLFVIHPH
jgi:hypothetical protein